MSILRSILCTLFLLACSTLAMRADVAEDIGRSWKGKAITLRVPDGAEHIRFSSNGEHVGKASEGLWSTDAMIQVESLKVHGRDLQIRGKRVANYFDRQKGSFERGWTEKDVRIDVELPDRSASVEELMPVLAKIFLTGSQQLTDIAPYYWRACLEGGIVQEQVQGRPDWRCQNKVAQRLPVNADSGPMDVPGFGFAYRAGSIVSGAKITAPMGLSTPDPKYPESARQAKYQGTSVLWLIVDRDGKPTNIQVVRPLGFGTDDAAVRAVEKWRFKPAMKGTEPVPVQINVEVNFRLY